MLLLIYSIEAGGHDSVLLSHGCSRTDVTVEALEGSFLLHHFIYCSYFIHSKIRFTTILTTFVMVHDSGTHTTLHQLQATSAFVCLFLFVCLF